MITVQPLFSSRSSGVKASPRASRFFGHLGVAQAAQGDGAVPGEHGAAAAVPPGQLGLGEDQVQTSQRVHVGQKVRLIFHQFAGQVPAHQQLQLVLPHGQLPPLLQKGGLFRLRGGADGLFQPGLLLAQGAETGVVGAQHRKGGKAAAVRVHQGEGRVHGRERDPGKGGQGRVGLLHLLQRDQEMFDLKQLHQVKRVAGVPVEAAADIMEQGQAAGHAAQGGLLGPDGLGRVAAAGLLLRLGELLGVPEREGEGQIVQLVGQGGFLPGAVPPGGAGGGAAEGGQGDQPVQHPLQAGMFAQLVSQFHGYSSFTFTTGRSRTRRRAETN